MNVLAVEGEVQGLEEVLAEAGGSPKLLMQVVQ
jgi:hypothetical protein